MQNQNEDCGCVAKGIPQGLHDITCSVTQQAMRGQGIDPTVAISQILQAVSEARAQNGAADSVRNLSQQINASGGVKEMMKPLREQLMRDLGLALKTPSEYDTNSAQAEALRELDEAETIKPKVPAHLKQELLDAFSDTVELLGTEAAKQRKRADGFKALYEGVRMELVTIREQVTKLNIGARDNEVMASELRDAIYHVRKQRDEAEQEADKYENDLEELKAERKKDHEMLLRVLGVLGSFHDGKREACSECVLVRDIKQLLQGEDSCTECAGQPEVDPT